jgi:hypothetical protein
MKYVQTGDESRQNVCMRPEKSANCKRRKLYNWGDFWTKIKTLRIIVG